MPEHKMPDVGSLIKASRRINLLSGDIVENTVGVIQWADHVRNEACVTFAHHGTRYVPLSALEEITVVISHDRTP